MLTVCRVETVLTSVKTRHLWARYHARVVPASRAAACAIYNTCVGEPIRVLLAEHHAAMCLRTRNILEQQAELRVVREAEDGTHALELVKRLQPDVAVHNIRMPRLNGIEVLRQIKGCCPNTLTLMVGAYDDDNFVMAAMEAGANGYILKTADAKHITEAVRVVRQGEPVPHPA
jgi:NarL family two-component system response regulator LiaR